MVKSKGTEQKAGQMDGEEKLRMEIQKHERSRRFTRRALDSVFSFFEIHEQEGVDITPSTLLHGICNKIQGLIPYQACALYLVNPETCDFELCLCRPEKWEEYMEKEMLFFIHQGIFSWALGEQRGLVLSSSDLSRELDLHPIATPTSLQGMFVGLYPKNGFHREDFAGDFLSLCLLVTAYELERIQDVSKDSS